MKLLIIIAIFGVMLGIDFYAYQSVKTASKKKMPQLQRLVRRAYWLLTAITWLAVVFLMVANNFQTISIVTRNFIATGIFTVYGAKLLVSVILLIEDIARLVKWLFSKLFHKPQSLKVSSISSASPDHPKLISRSEFLAKTGLLVSAFPVVGISFGILSGAHDYRVRRVKIVLPNLPKTFDGLRLAQISDIHTGSFFNKTAVRGGVEMLLAEKPDIITFTGDLVNYVASEVRDYMPLFEKLKAPLGVYSVLGNHDYGDYVQWASPEEKYKNLEDLKKAHALMGWRLLVNQHHFIEENGEKLAIIGVENWGMGRFPKYGKLTEACRGTEEAATKVLLSHDPSHWELQVRPTCPDIDLTLSGHTHGMQFGVEIPGFRWSPSKYLYKHWADLYQEGNQYLYVNRGFGYIGFPGRIGILPEITILELCRQA